MGLNSGKALYSPITPPRCDVSWLDSHGPSSSSSMRLHSTQMILGLVSLGGKRMARLWEGEGRPVWVEYWEQRRRWDGQSVCWHSLEQYLVEWHRAQALALGVSQMVQRFMMLRKG